MIELRKLGDEKESFLYQYDLGQDVVITPKNGYRVDSVEFWNETTDHARTGDIREENGQVVAEIPYELLQSDSELHVYAVMFDGGDRETKDHDNFTVISRPKPESYENDLLYHLASKSGTPVTDGNGALLTDKNGAIYTI